MFHSAQVDAAAASAFAAAHGTSVTKPRPQPSRRVVQTPVKEREARLQAPAYAAKKAAESAGNLAPPTILSRPPLLRLAQTFSSPFSPLREQTPAPAVSFCITVVRPKQTPNPVLLSQIPLLPFSFSTSNTNLPLVCNIPDIVELMKSTESSL